MARTNWGVWRRAQRGSRGNPEERSLERHPVSDRLSISALRRRLRGDFNALGMDPSLAFDCLVAVSEACTNALMHARPEDEESVPQVSWQIDREKGRFCIEDFSPHQWSKAVHPSRSDDLDAQVGGFGLELMRGLMDEVDIKVGPHGTRVELLKRFVELRP